METTSDRSKAMILHLSTFSQWFFPFGNFIFPLVIWSSLRKDSNFIDHHGKQAINFQLSVLVYTLVLALIAIPIAVFTIFRHVPFRSMLHDDAYIGSELTPENISGIAILAIMAAVLFCFLKIAEFFLVIYASVKATDGVLYEYPLCIPFIGSSKANNATPTDDMAQSAAADEQQIANESNTGVQSSSSSSESN